MFKENTDGICLYETDPTNQSLSALQQWIAEATRIIGRVAESTDPDAKFICAAMLAQVKEKRKMLAELTPL